MQESSVTPRSNQCTFFTPCTTVSKCYSLQSLLISSNSSSIGEATTTTAYHFKGNSASPSHNYLYELGLLNQLRNLINSILKLSPYVNVVSHSIFLVFRSTYRGVFFVIIVFHIFSLIVFHIIT